jgi:glycosyltransferase involved in cell wall biosynthesis
VARCLFVEPFYGGSHKAFLDGLQRYSRHSFETLTLDGSEWRKRMRRGAIDLATQSEGVDGAFDLVIATDMLDLPVFLALTRPRFDQTPVLLYFHENQFTYPRIRGTKFNSWFGQVNYLSALAADRVAFNSGFHRDELMGALRQLAHQPNNWLVAERIDTIEAKSEVLPVGVELGWIDEARHDSRLRPPAILWNHRWEFDKAPQVFVRAMQHLAEQEHAFCINVAGEPGDNPEPALLELPEMLPAHLRHHGYATSREDYGRLLWESRLVVSSTRHEFFGIATVEAMYAGCLPIVPDGFTYPELIPKPLHSRCLYQSESELRDRLEQEVAAGEDVPVDDLRQAAARFGWNAVAPAWDDAIERAVHAGSPRRRIAGFTLYN